jgi:D-3-phosphoglycerate dehydrogenase
MKLKKILVLDVIQTDAKDLLRKYMDVTEIETISTEGLGNIIPEYHAMISRNRPDAPHEVVDLMTNMKVIGVASAGTDFIDADYAKSKGILVLNYPGANSDSVAEMVVAAMVYLLHEAHKGCVDVKNGIWDRSRYESHQLIGKTVGLIGTGNIGKRVAKFLDAMGCPLLLYDPYISDEITKNMPGTKVDSMDELLKNSDIVSIHVPLYPSTKNLISKAQFDKMRGGSYIVNMSRGGIIDEEAMYDALASGKLRGAASDVMTKEPCLSSPLYKLDNFLIFPHFAGVTVEARRIIDIGIAKKILKEFGLGEQ